MTSDYVLPHKMFGECHAATIAETPAGLVCAWFAGTKERHPDVEIYVSHRVDGEWAAPVSVADGVQADGSRFPCWNPVLFQVPDGELILFYKIGPRAAAWWGALKRSFDHGNTWSDAELLPAGIYGPVKNKPVLHPDGRLLCGASGEVTSWCARLEVTRDRGKTWESIDIGHSDAWRPIQPSVLLWSEDCIQMVGRTDNSVVFQVWSEDGGKTWDDMSSTGLPNPNSGTDAVLLSDGRALLVYNHSAKKTTPEGGTVWGLRTPLNVAISADGTAWKPAMTLESAPGRYSYPAAIQTRDGMVHLVYTYNRDTIKHVVLEPSEI